MSVVVNIIRVYTAKTFSRT